MRNCTAAVVVTACLAAASAALAQADGVSDKELRELEASLVEEVATAEQPTRTPAGPGTSNPNVALTLIFASSWFSGDDAVQLGEHDPTQTGFALQQLELHMDSNVDPYARLDANLIFSDEGVELEEAYLTTLALPGNLQVRAGQFLFRLGRTNPTHPHAWAFADQPLVNGKFLGGEGARGPAVELSWLVPLPWFVELVTAVSEASSECCSRSFLGEDGPVIDGPDDLLYTPRIEQFFALGDDWSLLVGTSGQFGPSGPETRTQILGGDLYLRWRPVDSVSRTAVSLQIEGMTRRREVDGDTIQDHGGVATLLWDIDPNWQVGGRHELVTGLPDDPLDPDWTQTRQRSTAQVTWMPSHFSRLRLQGSHTQPDGVTAVILAVEVLIGAHGAHTY